jgi:hypothetical protein
MVNYTTKVSTTRLSLGMEISLLNDKALRTKPTHWSQKKAIKEGDINISEIFFNVQ